MGYACKLLADSISPNGVRLSTFELTFPRIVLAELNTHRMLSRSSASSRAIPVEKMLKRVEEDPFVPIYWGKNQKGMQAEVELTENEQKLATFQWKGASSFATIFVKALLAIGVHKQITNRLLEPWLWHTALVTGTDLSNLWHLRDHKDAQPELQHCISNARKTYFASKPLPLPFGAWHLPIVPEVTPWYYNPSNPSESDTSVWNVDGKKTITKDVDWNFWREISAGRCARVSLLTHDGVRSLAEDTGLHNRILGNGHMSPLEHQARPMTEEEREIFQTKRYVYLKDEDRWKWTGEYLYYLGNFNGWVQYRKMIPMEHDILGTEGSFIRGEIRT